MSKSNVTHRLATGWKLKNVKWVAESIKEGEVFFVINYYARPANWSYYSREPNEYGITERRAIRYTWVRRKKKLQTEKMKV